MSDIHYLLRKEAPPLLHACDDVIQRPYSKCCKGVVRVQQHTRMQRNSNAHLLEAITIA